MGQLGDCLFPTGPPGPRAWAATVQGMEVPSSAGPSGLSAEGGALGLEFLLVFYRLVEFLSFFFFPPAF